MNVFQFFIICKRTNNANNATHYVKLGKKRRESSKHNYYIISPGVIVKAIFIICCSARNTAHVGDLYPASSNSSVRFVSFRIVVISACSWPSQHCCFFRKFHPTLVIVQPRPGSRYTVRLSVVMILVSSTRSSHTCDESKILTKPPAEIF